MWRMKLGIWSWAWNWFQRTPGPLDTYVCFVVSPLLNLCWKFFMEDDVACVPDDWESHFCLVAFLLLNYLHSKFFSEFFSYKDEEWGCCICTTGLRVSLMQHCCLLNCCFFCVRTFSLVCFWFDRKGGWCCMCPRWLRVPFLFGCLFPFNILYSKFWFCQ